MKKLCIFLIMFLFLSACSKQPDTQGQDVLEEIPIEEIPLRSDPCEFLTKSEWRGYSESYGYMFGHIFSLNNTGEYTHLLLSELDFDVEFPGVSYRYKESEKTIYIFDEEGKLVDKGKVIYVDYYYLVIDFGEECCAFYAHDGASVYEDLPEFILHESAQKYILGVTHISLVTKPRLRIAEYGEGTISVFQCTYDPEEAAKAEVWELKLAKDCEFKSVVYSVSSDTAEETILEKSDYESIPAEYADGFFDFNDDGEVISVVFYGEVD